MWKRIVPYDTSLKLSYIRESASRHPQWILLCDIPQCNPPYPFGIFDEAWKVDHPEVTCQDSQAIIPLTWEIIPPQIRDDTEDRLRVAAQTHMPVPGHDETMTHFKFIHYWCIRHWHELLIHDHKRKCQTGQ